MRAWYNKGAMEEIGKVEYYYTLITGEKREKFEQFRTLLLEYNE